MGRAEAPPTGEPSRPRLSRRDAEILPAFLDARTENPNWTQLEKEEEEIANYDRFTFEMAQEQVQVPTRLDVRPFVQAFPLSVEAK